MWLRRSALASLLAAGCGGAEDPLVVPDDVSDELADARSDAPIDVHADVVADVPLVPSATSLTALTDVCSPIAGLREESPPRNARGVGGLGRWIAYPLRLQSLTAAAASLALVTRRAGR